MKDLPSANPPFILPAVQIDASVCESASASSSVTSLFRQFPTIAGFAQGLNSDRADYPPSESHLLSLFSPVESPGSGAMAVTVRSRGAFELKYSIDENQASEIKDWARNHLHSDPHADPACDGYRVSSLYLDTPRLDVFHRSEYFRQRKFRLRRYGSEPIVWLEVKRKRRGLVKKRRISVAEADLIARLTQPFDAGWDGTWYRQRMEEQQLQPVSQVTYQRFARMKSVAQGTIRLTIDDRLMASPAVGWQVPSHSFNGTHLLDGQRILELKFREVMPTLFRQLVDRYQLVQTPFSKYRTSVEECIHLDQIAGEKGEGLEHA